MDDLIITVFCKIDNFIKYFNSYLKKNCLPEDKKANVSLEPPGSLALSEIMTVCVTFHLSGYRTFKRYYIDFISKYYRKFFPKLVSYNRFVELMPYAALPLTFFTHIYNGRCTGISFIDSTTIDVCDNHRIHQHKVFKDIAQTGKTSTGWFYGFKLHLIINDRGEILSFCLTSGNTDDRNTEVISKLTKNIFGKLFGDKGYISQKLFYNLWEKGIELITKQKKNAKYKGLMEITDRILLRKRAVIESVNDFPKNICQTEHSRHRSLHNFIVNLVSGIVAYSFIPKKPSLQFGNKRGCLIPIV